jgi:hypothetical protein
MGRISSSVPSSPNRNSSFFDEMGKKVMILPKDTYQSAIANMCPRYFKDFFHDVEVRGSTPQLPILPSTEVGQCL